jgi:hypothetical protein
MGESMAYLNQAGCDVEEPLRGHNLACGATEEIAGTSRGNNDVAREDEVTEGNSGCAGYRSRVYLRGVGRDLRVS